MNSIFNLFIFRQNYHDNRTELTMGNVLSANFAPECDIPKKKYDDCFAKWYGEKFLQAKSVHNECEDTWREYEDCLYVC